MKITYKEKITDLGHPIMHGKSPIAKEFNRRQAKLLKENRLEKVDYQLISTVLLEILCDDYDKRHLLVRKNKKDIDG